MLARDRALHQALRVRPALELCDALPLDPRADAEARPARLARELLRVTRRLGDDGDVARRLALPVLLRSALIGAQEADARLAILLEQSLAEGDHSPLEVGQDVLRPHPQRADLRAARQSGLRYGDGVDGTALERRHEHGF